MLSNNKKRKKGKNVMSIIVLGSINMDLVVHTPRLPKPGETLTGTSFHTTPGGKGANQAVACARLGASTQMIGRVGEDFFGSALKNNLLAYGVDITGISSEVSTPSGVALIEVDDAGENTIIVIPGANGIVGAPDLRHLETVLPQAKILLLQLEVPLDTAQEAAQMASAQGVTVILDPAPAKILPESLYSNVDILTPNTSEASILAGFPVETTEDAQRAARTFLDKGLEYAVIKMGARGAYVANQSWEKHFNAIPVEVVDTVAAGDAFNGALAVALSEGLPIEEAMVWGISGGAIAVTKPGAQEAMPARDQLLKLISASRI
jgi:ribokinase